VLVVVFSVGGGVPGGPVTGGRVVEEVPQIWAFAACLSFHSLMLPSHLSISPSHLEIRPSHASISSALQPQLGWTGHSGAKSVSVAFAAAKNATADVNNLI
jgi:hypothetical protein